MFSINISLFSSFSPAIYRISPTYARRIFQTTSKCSQTSLHGSKDFLGAAGPVYDWIRKESLPSLISQSDMARMIQEIRSNPAFMHQLKGEYEYGWTKITQIMDNEDRTMKEILGSDITNKILAYVEGLDIYEPNTVRTFLSNPVFESMLGSILYEGILEFLQKVDIIGNIINKMPVIGAIRVAIMKEVKLNLDKTLGVQIKTFLASFNKIAVQRMAEFIISTQNRKALEKANSNLVGFLLQKKLKDVLPMHGEANKKIKQFIWSLFIDTSIDDINTVLTKLYSSLGDQQIGELLRFDFQDIASASPTGQRVFMTNADRFLSSPQGKEFIKSIDPP